MEIKFILTKENFAGGVSTFRRKRLIFLIILSLLIIIGGVYLATIFNYDKTFYSIGLFFIFFGIITLISHIIREIKANSLLKRQFEQYHGNECEYLFKFEDDRIIDFNLKSGNKVEHKYATFKKVILGKKYIFICTNLKQITFIPKEQLSEEEIDLLIVLLKSKGIKIK